MRFPGPNPDKLHARQAASVPGNGSWKFQNVFRLVPRPSRLLDLLIFMGLTSCSILIDCDHWVFHNFGPIDLFSLYLLFLDAGHVITGLRTIKNSFLQISSYSIRCICTQNLWKVKGVHFLTPSLGKQNTQAKELYFGIELLLHCWLFKWRHFVTWTITNIAWSGLGALNSTTASGELYFKGGGGRGYDVIMLMAYLIVRQFWPIKRSQTIWLTIYQWKKRLRHKQKRTAKER